MKGNLWTGAELHNLFFNYEGRLNRKPFNIVFTGLLFLYCIVAIIFSSNIILIPLLFIIIIFTLCPGIKRLNDRGYSGLKYYKYFFFIPLILMILTIRICPDLTKECEYPMIDSIGNLSSLVLFASCIWATVQMCFLRGTQGPNEYGPDPLETSSENVL